MKSAFCFLAIFLVNATTCVFSQDKSYFSADISDQNEISLQVLNINNNNTYSYYSLFCNENGAWTTIDSCQGVWHALNSHNLEFMTFNYLLADTETRKLLRILSVHDYRLAPYFSLKMHKHHLANKKCSSNPMVVWKRLSFGELERSRIKDFLVNSKGFSPSLFIK